MLTFDFLLEVIVWIRLLLLVPVLDVEFHHSHRLLLYQINSFQPSSFITLRIQPSTPIYLLLSSIYPYPSLKSHFTTPRLILIIPTATLTANSYF
jgi:hypothetical protein